MITLIIKSYLMTMLAVLVGSLGLFFTGLYFIFKTNKPAKKTQPEPKSKPISPVTITSNDITAIAGDDVIATQLDLARAYIETGKQQLAKKILQYAIEHGSDKQQQEAHSLLGLI